MIISFVGHSCVPSSTVVKEKVKEQIRNYIIDRGSVICYLGGYGDFDNICASACKELKKEYSCIETIFVSPYLIENRNEKGRFGVGIYDSLIYPPIENVPVRFAILKRNEWMMENADLVIAYVKHNHGGAYKTLCVAKRKKKLIVNISDLL